jgi:RNA recognition motif-containing protein
MAMGMTRGTPTIQPTTAWHAPALLPERADAPLPQVNSKEFATQTTRMANTTAAQYISDYNVPSNPAPLSDVEQALDMASQTSAVVQPIPFFVPQAPPAPEPVAHPHASQMPSYSSLGGNAPGNGGYGMPPPSSYAPVISSTATAEIVQSLGLPMFLVGQNVQALQTLASTPSLLSTFVDGNGMYDQTRLTSLVQTLTQNIAPAQQQAPPMPHESIAGGYQQPNPSPSFGSGGMQHQYGGAGGGGGSGAYGSASGSFGQSQPGQSQYGGGGGYDQGGGMKNGYRGTQNNGDGNLHLSGYGPAVTESDIINLFAPYVQVDEVVMKGTFCFVNTRDPEGSKQAREVLNGALLGGSPVRINMAQRKNRDGANSSFRNNNSAYGNSGGSNMNNMGGGGGGIGMQGRSNPPGMPPMQNQPPDASGGLENVRDDRGNPATKNLFVAGYGPGTTEQEVRDLFGQHCTIIGIIMKGTFSFVNTSIKLHAIQTREALSGTMMNGGVLRINFAKETGRLGTSFDLTYRGAAGPGGPGGPGGGGGGSVGGDSRYGRGGY